MKKFFKHSTIMAALIGATVMCNGVHAQKPEDFKFIIDEFADCKVMKYQMPDWDSLSLKQKQYLFCLSQAALWGRDIYYDQNYKHNLKIRKALETILTTYKGDRTCEDWKKFEVYAKRFFFANGIHHFYGEKKFFPDCSKAYFVSLLSGQKDADFVLQQIYDPDIAPVRRDNNPDNDIVQTSAVNFYENISRKEAEDYYNGIETDSLRPVSLGINSKLVKENGKITEKIATTSQMYGKYLQKIVGWLEKSLEFAENDKQIAYTKKLIEFYKTGDLTTWDEYNILWSQDTESVCDYVNGFVETYNDPLGMKGAWESIVDYKDLKSTKRTEIICNNAQWFEDNSPVKPEYRKKKVTGVSAKVINAAMLAGDSYPTPPIGINLPNADWIRKQYGSKSVTIANLSDAYFYASMESPKSALKEFAYSQKEIDRELQYGMLSDNLHTDMHECLGHASGQLLETTPANALKEYSSTLEEARADLFALYYLMDKKMMDLGLVSSLETGKAQYDSYIRNGLLIQLARIPLGENITEAHMQNRKLICEYALQNGNGCVKKETKDGKTYFVVTDYQQLRKVFGQLLYIIQDIKSRGDYDAGKDLVERYGVKIDKDLHNEVLKRYENLNIKPYGGFVNPDLVQLIDSKGNVKDILVIYPKSFIDQQLFYSKEYSFNE
ncbi:MAG: dihydrofolate reductase [Bacteroidales bacterium]|nr:dihydrofolate reductase [Bacteroidales bacterium]